MLTRRHALALPLLGVVRAALAQGLPVGRLVVTAGGIDWPYGGL